MPSDFFIGDGNDGWDRPLDPDYPYSQPQPHDAPDVHYFRILLTPRIITTNNTNMFQWPFGNVSGSGTSQWNFFSQGAFPREIHLTIHGDITDETYIFLAQSGIFPGMTPDEIRQALEENGETYPEELPARDESWRSDELNDRDIERLEFLRWQIDHGYRDEFSGA